MIDKLTRLTDQIENLLVEYPTHQKTYSLMMELVSRLKFQENELIEALKFYEEGWKFRISVVGDIIWSPTEELLEDCGMKAKKILKELEGD